MTITAPENDPNLVGGISRRTIVKGAAWSLPVVAVAVSTPLAAASVGLAALTFDVTPIVTEEAPFGATSVRVSNTSTVGYSGPLTFTTPPWVTTAAFSIAGATESTVGGVVTWTIPSVTVPAGETLILDLTWDGPYPLTAETQPLVATVDPLAGAITPTGVPTVTSPYQLLWWAATPGGQGNTSGTPSFFIGNTTETALADTGDIRTDTWSFPLPVVRTIETNGVTHTGVRIAENGGFRGYYADVTLAAPARTGRQVFTFTNQTAPVAGTFAQQGRQLRSITTDPATTFALLGSGTLYGPYRTA